jgi:hypothetical protein
LRLNVRCAVKTVVTVSVAGGSNQL